MNDPSTPPNPAPKAALSDYLAAERTLLAWIRTGLALMGFGFVVARFGIFLQQLQTVHSSSEAPNYGESLWFGTALIALGIAVNIVAGAHHLRLVRELDRGAASHSRSTIQAVTITFVLALLGLAMAIYLISLRSSPHAQPATTKETTMTLSSEKENTDKENPAQENTAKGIINIPSNHSVDQTVDKLKAILQAKGVTLFALVDHSGEAEKIGLQMPPTKLLIFGSPKAGTPLMLAAPSIAIDLPLKILVSQDTAGKVWVSWNSPAYLQQRHGIPDQLLQNIAVVETLATKAAE
jgi:uncharacterized protein (DUF302 family)/uncharacterized membrane protein YidH (DUF202 family)